MQKSILVDGGKSNETLNKYLSEGWIVVSAHGFSVGVLVIIKKGK